MSKTGKKIQRILCVLLSGAMLLTTTSCKSDKGSTGDGSSRSTGDALIRVAHSADKILQDQSYEDEELLSEFTLNCFRNEYEAGQLILTAVNDIEEYNVEVGTFSNGSGEISSDSFELYHEYYHEVEAIYDTESTMPQGMYPDALIPMETAVEKKLNNVKKGNNQGIWIAVKIPKEQEAGIYSGSFRVTINEKEVEVPATITVVDYTLPDTVSLKSCVPIQIGYMFNGELDDTQEMYEKHLDTLNRFRLSGEYLSSYLPSSTYDAYETAVYDANLAVKYHEKDSCSAYAIRVIEKADATYGYILNEEMFMSYLQAYIDVGVENNVNLFSKAYVYMGNICDEPEIGGLTDRAQYCALQFDRCLEQAASYLQTKSCDAALKEEIKKDLLSLSNVVTGSYTEKLSNVNTYCPTIDYYGSGVAETDYKELHDQGKDYWFYTCTQPKIPYPTYHIDDNGVSSRMLGWMAKDFDASGYLTWEMIYNMKAGAGPTTQLYGQELYDDVHRWGDAYGDGFLVYPGRLFDLDEPVVSLRLFTICDGMEDYEALADLEKTYTALGDKAGITGLSPDSVLQVLYDSLYRSARVYADGTQVEQAKKALAQLLVLANQEIAVEKFSVEGSTLHLSVTAPAKTTISAGGEALTASEELGAYARYEATLELSGKDASEYEIQAADTTVTLNLGGQIRLLEDFESEKVLTASSDTVSLTSGETDGASVVTAVMSGAENYNIIYNVEKNAITKNTEGMFLSIYNNGTSREKMTIYFNGKIVLDSVYLEPGKNVYHYSKLGNLNWTSLKTIENIVFQIEESGTGTHSISFDTLSVSTNK